jgi:HEAT repeat protein
MRHELAGLTEEPFEHSNKPGQQPTVFLDGPTTAKRRIRPREEILTFDEVLKRLSSKTRANRVKAVRQLGRIGSEVAVTTLLDLLKHDYDYHVRCEAAETLGRMRVETAIDPLIAAIDDEGMNTTAIHALSGFGDERSAQWLLGILGEGGMYATSAAHVLGIRGDNRAVDYLARFLISKDPRDNHIGNISGRLIADFQGPGLVALEPLATDADVEIRRRSIVGLGDIAFGAKEKSIKARARQILRKCLESETDPELRRLLEVEIEITTKKSD